MQGTEFDDLRAARDRPGGPTLLPQIVEQRKALFQFFDILAHRRSFASGGERRRRWSAFPGKDGGQEEISQSRRGQRICRTGVSQDKGPAW